MFKMSAKRQNESDSEDDEFKDLAIWRKPQNSHDNSMSLQFEIPPEVQAVINKIEESQLTRAKEDLISRLAGIMNNVQLIMTRYNIDSLSPGRKGSVSESQKKKRKAFLEKIAVCVKNIDIRDRTLSKILSWLEKWNFVLSEVAAIDMDEYHHWIAKMELMPDMLKGIKNNVKSLIQMTLFLIEEKKRQKKKTLARGSLWKAWKDRAIKRPATAQALRPDQMICDQIGLSAKVSEIQSMLQELISTAMFSKLENNALKYMSATLMNLSKALGTVNEELRLVSYRVARSFMKEEQEERKEKDPSQQVIQELSEENEVLQQKLREAEERCDQLIRIKNYLGRQMMHPVASLRTVVTLPLQVPYVSREARDTESDQKTDDSQKEEAKGGPVTWDSSASEADPAAKQPPEDKAKTTQDQRKPKALPPTAEPSGSDLEMEEKKPGHPAVPKDLEKRKTGKPKGPEAKGVSSTWGQLKKDKSELLFQRSPGSPESRESALKLADKEAKSERDLLQPEAAPELQKPGTKWKKLIAEKSEEMLGFKNQAGKLQPKALQGASGTPEESERQQVSLESFQKAILAFLREKTNNAGKAFDMKSIKREESSLGKVEIEKLNVIKAKMEEYFQKVAETVTIALRMYRDERKVELKEKPKKQPKGALGAPRTPPKLGMVSPKSEVGRVLLSEITDPAIKKLVQMLLAEIDSDLNYKKTKEQQREEVEARKEEPKPKLGDKTELPDVWRQAFKVPETRRVQDLREAEEGEKPKWREPSQPDLRKVINQPTVNLAVQSPKTPKSQISQVQPAVMGAPEEKQPKLSPPSSKTLFVSAKLPQTRVPEQAQTIGPQMFPQLSKSSLTSEQAETLSGPLTHEQELGTRLMVPRIHEPTQTPKGSLTSEKPQAVQISKVTTEEISGVTVTRGTSQPIQQVQIKDRIRTSQQALGQETTPTPEQYKGPRITLTPEQTQALGITLTPEQMKTQRVSLTHAQAQALGITLTPEQYNEQRISLTPQQAQVLGITLNLQQAKALGITLTPEQVKAQRVSLIPQQSQVQGTTLTTQQAEAQRINLTPEQAKALGLSLTPPQPVTLAPEQTQALGITPTPQPITLTPELTQTLGITPTPQPITLTSEQTQTLGITLTPRPITLTPEQAQTLALTVSAEQVKTQRISLSSEQTQALGITPTPQPITLTPEQAQALGITPTPQPITLTPEQTQTLGITLTPRPITLTPEQAQTLALTVSAEQVKTQRISLSPEQTQALGITPTPQPITLTPEQAQALGITPTPQPITLTPEQTQTLGITLTPRPITLTPEQAQTLALTVSAEQVKTQRISLSPEQTQALGITPTPQPITFTPEQAQTLGITLTPRPITLTPEQAQALAHTLTADQVSLSPHQAQTLGIALTPQRTSLSPEQTQALGITPTPQPITLTSEQTQALGITPTPQPITLSPEQAQTLGITPTPQPITLTPEQTQALGITPTPQPITLTPEQTQALGITPTPQPITLTPEQTQALGIIPTPQRITLSPEKAQALGITLTPQPIPLAPEQIKALITPTPQPTALTPEQIQDLGISLIPQQQEISLSPQQAQALGLTLTPQQAHVQKVYLTPQQAQALGVTLTPQQAKALKISLTPQQAHSLGITLTVEQARAQKISLTPQQAQDLGLTLTPEQAQDLGISLIPQQQEISLSPQQAQALGLTLTPQQAQVQKVYFTPQQAQALGVTLTPQQAKALKISLTPQQAHSLGIILTVEQARAQRINLTPQQAESLGLTLTPEQAQALGISLIPREHKISFSAQQAQALGLTLTPQQAQVQKVYLTPQQAQALDITLSPEQAKTMAISLTPEQAHSLGITLTVDQVNAQKINLTPQQAQDLGITLTPGQARDLGFSFIPREQEISFNLPQAQALGLTLTPQQAQVQKIYLTPQQAQALGVTLSPDQAKALKISLTPEQAHSLGITLTVEQARAQKINLTPQQAESLGLTLTPEQAQDLGLTLTPEQVQDLGVSLIPKEQISLSPLQAQILGLTLTPQQAQVQKVFLTPQQAKALGISLSPEQVKAQEISLTPQQAHSLGITLTVEQANAQKISLTPQQAQDLGITLTPQQAQDLGIAAIPKQAEALGIFPTPTPEPVEERSLSLTPEQVQALRISFPPKATQSLGIYLTPKQAQKLGITLTANQAKVMKISLTPEQARALGITFTYEQAKAQRTSLTPEQAQALGITLTPEQAQAHRITLTPEQAQALGITLTPEQAQALGITLSLEQIQAQGILSPKKFQELDAPLTYKQAKALKSFSMKQLEAQRSRRLISESIQMPKPAVASKQTQTVEIPLTIQQSEADGAPLSKKQETELGISPLTPKQTQAVGALLSKRQDTKLGTFPLTPKQTQAVGALLSKRLDTKLGTFPLTPKQTQAKQPLLTPRQALPPQDQFAPELTQMLVFTITREKAQNLGIAFTYEQTQAAAVTLTSEQVTALEDALTEELAWRWGPLVTPEKAQEAADIVTTKQPQALGIAACQSAQALHAPFTLEKPATLVPSTDRLSQRSKDFHPDSIPLQALRPSLTQAPFSPTTSLGMSILPDSEKPWMSPIYRQTLEDRGQGIPAQPLAPEIPPSLRQLLAPGAPPTPGPPLGLRHFFKARDTWLPLMSELPFPSRTPPGISGEVPGLVSGGSAAPGELLISKTSPFQPPAVHEQAPFSQPEPQGPSQIVPEGGFMPTTSPTPLHPSTAEALPTPGRTHRISPSSAEPLKPKSARDLPGAAQTPFSVEKTQSPKIPGTSGQTQAPQDSVGTQPFGIFQPYVTSSRIPRSQSPLIGEKVLFREKPGLPLPSLTTQVPQTPQISISVKGQKPRFPPIDKPWTPIPVSGTREDKMTAFPSTDQQPEDSYVVDVEAQRKNLATLNQAAQTSGLPAQYLTIAKNLIIELLHIDTVRLGYLSRKYVAYRLIQLARNHLSKRVKTIQNTGKGYEIQKLYLMLDRVDQYQKKMMQGWTDKQKQLDERRKQCLRSMTQLFSQLERAFKLNLSQPMPSVPPSFKKTPEFTKLERPVLELLIDDSKRSDLFKTLGQAPLEAVWNADLSTASYPIMEKAPMSVLWAQLGGYPDIPKLLQLDIQSTFRKSLASIRAQSKKIRK